MKTLTIKEDNRYRYLIKRYILVDSQPVWKTNKWIQGYHLTTKPHLGPDGMMQEISYKLSYTELDILIQSINRDKKLKTILIEF